MGRQAKWVRGGARPEVGFCEACAPLQQRGHLRGCRGMVQPAEMGWEGAGGARYLLRELRVLGERERGEARQAPQPLGEGVVERGAAVEGEGAQLRKLGREVEQHLLHRVDERHVAARARRARARNADRSEASRRRLAERLREQARADVAGGVEREGVEAARLQDMCRTCFGHASDRARGSGGRAQRGAARAPAGCSTP